MSRQTMGDRAGGRGLVAAAWAGAAGAAFGQAALADFGCFQTKFVAGCP